jgi:hypothetical protein
MIKKIAKILMLAAMSTAMLVSFRSVAHATMGAQGQCITPMLGVGSVSCIDNGCADTGQSCQLCPMDPLGDCFCGPQ